MERQEIAQRVKQVIGRVLKTDPAALGDEDNFIFDLGADSMQSVQLVAAFEEEFDIEMAEDKALQVQTVSGAVDFIAGCLR
jgi:acyl carrier protein